MTSEKIVTDSYAWIEYFKGSKSGSKVRKYIQGSYQLVVPAIVIAELSDVYRRNGKTKEWEERKKPFIEMISFICPVETWIADHAGKIKTNRRKIHSDFSLQDGIVAATAELTKGKILTGDKYLLGKNSINI